MDKIILLSSEINERFGGPSGYLANLIEGFDKIGYDNITVIARKSIEKPMERSYSITKSLLLKKIYENTSYIFPKLLFLFFKKRLLIKNSRRLRSIYSYPITQSKKLIHFHSTSDMFTFLNEFGKKENNIYVLTSHSPEAPFVEKVNCYKFKYSLSDSFIKLLKNFYETMDKEAFEKADYLIFPCREAMEPYYETWEYFREMVKDKKIKYVPTGVKKLNYSINKDQIKRKYSIPSKAFVVSYVGRHNYVKGYDLLKEAAKHVWNYNPKVYFLIAGKEEPLKGIKDDRWIEIGWTNDPGSIINASDIFVLPNRRTYFDLILLEVMSLGKPVIASNTGGNKYVAKQTEGIILFERENIKQLSRLILELSTEESYLGFLGNKNFELYKSYYTVEEFAKRYVKVYREIEEENL